MSSSDFRLIELIRQNKHLYNRSDPDFRNLEKKEITWQAIAAAQGSTSEICRRRFRGLRDRFVKERRHRKQELLDGTCSNPIWLKMMFLWDHFRPRRRFNWNRPNNLNKRFQTAKSGAVTVQNVYTVLPVDSSGAPSPNHSVATGRHIRVNATAKKSPTAAARLNSTVEEPSEVAEYASSETPLQESPEAVAEASDVAEEESSDAAEQVSPESVAQVPSNVTEQVSPKGVVEVPSDVVEVLLQEAIKLESPKTATAKVFQRAPILSKRVLQSRGKKRLKYSIATGKPSKKPKTVEVSPSKNPGNSQNQTKAVTDSSCNAEFCTVVKSYLDQISNPMRLSATRIKLLSLVHDDMYSTS